jgi:hypothetical protein
VFYASATVALLVILPPDRISEMNGLAEAGGEAARTLGIGALGPVVAFLVVASGMGQLGGFGTSVSRLPFAASADGLLPKAFARVHPRWHTPHVSILVLGGVATFLLVAIQLGDSLRGAYQELVSLMVITGFFPFLYIFGSSWKAGNRWSAVSGRRTIVAILCAVVPTAEIHNVWLFEGSWRRGLRRWSDRLGWYRAARAYNRFLMATATSRPATSHVRWTVCALLFFGTTINYVDRQVLSLLAKTLQDSIGWTNIEYSDITSAFTAAYALGMLGSGRLLDKYGARIGYALAVTVWSIAAMAHAAAASARLWHRAGVLGSAVGELPGVDQGSGGWSKKSGRRPPGSSTRARTSEPRWPPSWCRGWRRGTGGSRPSF